MANKSDANESRASLLERKCSELEGEVEEWKQAVEAATRDLTTSRTRAKQAEQKAATLGEELEDTEIEKRALETRIHSCEVIYISNLFAFTSLSKFLKNSH